MKEYIEREAALACKQPIGAYGMDISSEDIKAIPAADVVEVRHGVPNPIEEVYEDTDGAHVYRHIVGYECPFCGSDRIAKYCPNCGAEMTEVLTDEDDYCSYGERKGGDD